MESVTTLPWGRPLTAADLASHPFGDVDLQLVDGSLVLSRPGGFTEGDLWDFPEDGRRYELLDGEVLVTPSPGWGHQSVQSRLFAALVSRCPDGLRVLCAPLDIPMGDRTTLQPDLMVVRADDRHPHGRRQLPHAPLLAVEILSPSTRRFDLERKRLRYARAGVPSYWVVDPDAGPHVGRLIAWELAEGRYDGGRYVEVADVSGDEEWSATAPYPVALRPADLLR